MQPDLIYTGVNLASNNITNLSGVAPGTQVIAIAPQNAASILQHHQHAVATTPVQQVVSSQPAQPSLQPPTQKRPLSLTVSISVVLTYA